MLQTTCNTKVSVMAIPGIVKDRRPVAIINKVQLFTGQGIYQNTRKREVVEARQIAMYLVKNINKLSLAETGAICAMKDHATVLHACRTVESLRLTNKAFNTKYNDLFMFYGL